MTTRFFSSRFYSRFLLFFFFLMVAAASFNGFYTRWNLNDGSSPALEPLFVAERSAYRPYIYSELFLFPTAAADRIQTLFYMAFFVLFASLFVMRRLCMRAGASGPAAIAAPAIMALLLPFMLPQAGYFYDFLEVLFMMSAVLLALGVTSVFSRNALILLLWAWLATWNKEAFFWFVPALYPLLRGRLRRIHAAGLVIAMMFIAGYAYLAIRERYATTVDFQLWDNLLFYVSPGHWFRTENRYGILLPRGFSIVFFLIFAGITVKAWRCLPAAIRTHGATAAAINLPLFLLFCSPGEMRNLSMLYPVLVTLIACGLSSWLHCALRRDEDSGD